MKIANIPRSTLRFFSKTPDIDSAVDFATSVAATLARLGSGARVAHLGPRPARIFELFEREDCPFSRKVREALSTLDLDAVIHPCTPTGGRFRAAVIERAGSFRIPVLVDPNAGVTLTDSNAIVRHLFEHYGDGRIPLPLRPNPLTDASSKLASRLRASSAEVSIPSVEPEELLELYGYEASPQCRLVREVLTRFEIPYILHNVALGSPKRPAFVARTGRMEVPWLLDPVHGISMFGARGIIRYLEDHYAASEAA